MHFRLAQVGSFWVAIHILALIILIVAIFLFSRKPTEKSTFRHGLGASLFVFAIFVFLHANIADLADVFTAWATIVLAGIAALSFEESRRLRKQYKEREEWDRKERLLNEISEWAIDIYKCNFGREITRVGEGEIEKIEHEMISLGNLLMEHQALSARGERIKVIANGLKNKDKGLESTVDSLTKCINKVRNAIIKCMEDINNEANSVDLREKQDELDKAAIKLIKLTAEIGIDDKD